MINHPTESVQLASGIIDIDAEISRLVLALDRAGVGTLSCCQQDYIVVGDEAIQSDHAYVEFDNSENARMFLQMAMTSKHLAAEQVVTGLSVMLGYGSIVSEGWPREAYALPRLGSYWGTASWAWHNDFDHYVGIGVSVAFPRSAIEPATAAIEACQTRIYIEPSSDG